MCSASERRMDFQNKPGGSTYNPYTALNSVRKNAATRSVAPGLQDGDGAKQKVSFRQVLDYVQNKISTNEDYQRTLTSALDADDTNEQLQNIIYSLLQRYPVPLDEDVVNDFRVRIYEEMVGLGILTRYVDDPEVEEINGFGPGPNQIEVISSKGHFMLEEGFADAQAIQNVVKRMVRKGNMVIDQSNPRVDSYMGPGVRISAMIPPVVREDKGAVFSIRKQTKAKITRDDLISSTTAMDEEFRFIELCCRNKVSGAVVGATGSGKTTLLNYLMTDYVETAQEDTRVYIIEESRELQLPEDAKVIYTAVCGEGATEVTAPDLLKSALRFHPTFISCAEMRGEEAMNAMTAAQTGHIVWSTFHADNCVDAYQRLLTMCKMSGTDLSEHLLMQNLVSAFPIIVSTQQMKDGSRKITGIYEADGVDGVHVVGHYIYKMQITRYAYREDGSVEHVYGMHCRVGDLSDRMAQRIFDNCGRFDAVQPFARKGWQPESIQTSASASGNTLKF